MPLSTYLENAMYYKSKTRKMTNYLPKINKYYILTAVTINTGSHMALK